jgi:hypothetical protein
VGGEVTCGGVDFPKKTKKKSEAMKKEGKKMILAAMTSGAMYPGDPHRSTSPSPNCVAKSSFATDAALVISICISSN